MANGKFQLKERSVLPGFGLSLGYTLLYLSVLVLIPLSLLFFKAGSEGWEGFVKAAFAPRSLASYKVTFGCSLLAALLNLFFGLLVAWVLVRYSFPGKSIVDAIVDLPFALPTAVGGIALVTAYGPNGVMGEPLTRWATAFGKSGIGHWFTTTKLAAFLQANLGLDFTDFKIAYTPIGITIALTFISLPFVVRTVQPVLQELDAQVEEAASSLGAGRWFTFRRVIFPYLWPALLTGFALGFARAVGEYGSVVFIAGNMPMKTEIAPLLIITKLEEYDYAGATSIAAVMLVASFILLLAINGLQWWSGRRSAA
jgi:sulfate transport system permease protein